MSRRRTVTLEEHLDWVREQGRTVDVPDSIREQHQPDPNRLEAGCQCICTCGARCASYPGHLLEAAEHAAWWEQAHPEAEGQP